MKTIDEGYANMTIEAAANEVYKVIYEDNPTVDIFNDTSGEILVNTTGTFTVKDGVGDYLTIPSGGSYNSYRPVVLVSGRLYIKTAGTGDICVIRKGY